MLSYACRDSFHLTKYSSFSQHCITVDLDTTSTSEIDTAKAMERVSQRDAISSFAYPKASSLIDGEWGRPSQPKKSFLNKFN